MVKMFISAAVDDHEMVSLISSRLKENYDVFSLDHNLGRAWKLHIEEAIKQADVIVVLITANHLRSHSGYAELQYLVSYVEGAKRKLFIPLIIGDIEVPSEISYFHYLKLNPADSISLEHTVSEIDRAIISNEGRVIAKEEIASKQKEQLESKAAVYVNEAITELRLREKKLSDSAIFWYWMGYGAIAIGVLASVIFSFISYSHFGNDGNNWDLVTFTAIKSIVLVGLLLAMAKYSFTLAKSFMDESLKNADRIHAILFGKFFLQSFGNETNSADIKEVFQHWNISSKNSFSNLSAEVIEPKVLETAFELAKIIKQDEKKP